MSGDRHSSHTRTGRYCVHCGSGLEPSMNFCPNCGTSVDSGYDHSSGSDRDRLEYRIATALEEGWELEHDFGDHAVLVRRSFGSAGTHVLIAIFTLWWTMGLGNAVYAAIRYLGSEERKIVRPDGTTPADTDRYGSVPVDQRSVNDRPVRTHPRPSETRDNDRIVEESAQWTSDSGSSPVALLFAVGFLWIIGVALLAELSLVASGFGLLFLVMGAAMIPSVRQRIRDREPITTNGMNKTVEERPVSDPDRLCSICRQPIDEGVKRTYREELTLLGVSLATTDTGENYYCWGCLDLEEDKRVPSETPNARSEPTAEQDVEAVGRSD